MKRLTIGIAALACAGLVAGGALAAKVKVKTSVAMTNPSTGVYTGKVTAKKGCGAARLVAVWHDTNGNGQIDGEPDDFKIGEEVSASDGTFTVNGNQAPRGDNVIAVVEQSKRKKKVCKEGRTTIAAGPGARDALRAGVKTKVKVDNSAVGEYDGEVIADELCHEGRKVTVYHDENGDGDVDKGEFKIGKDESDDGGDYSVVGAQAPRGDKIVAIAAKTKLGDGTRCKKGIGSTTAEF